MNKYRKMNLEILDNKFNSYHLIEKPKDGWIKAIRNSLSMPLSYIARKLNISYQAVSGLEKSEIDETISIGKLRKVAEAMGCRLHYVLIPDSSSLHKVIEKQARLKATEIVEEVDKSMALENQAVGKNKSIKILTKELANNPNYKLWGKDD